MEQQIDQQDEENEDLGKAHDQHAESVGALIQGGGWRRPPQAAADLAELGCQAGGADHQPGRTVHHRAAHEGGVGCLGDFRAVDAFIARVFLRRVGLARQQCLVDEKIPGLEEAPIRRDQIPGGEQHDIAGDEVLPQYRNLLPVAQDLLLERHRDLERLGGLLGAVFLHGVEHRAHQHDCRNDDEAGQIAGERGNHRRHQQNDHERVAEPTEEFERQRQTPPLLQSVRAIAEPARGGLGGAEAVSDRLRAAARDRRARSARISARARYPMSSAIPSGLSDLLVGSAAAGASLGDGAR